MDRIFVLDHGRLAEAGTHAELLETNGLYARLWRKQHGVRFEPVRGEASVDVDLLAQIPALARLDEKALAELARSFTTEIFEDHREMIRQGEKADRLFVIVEGCAELSVREGAASTKIVGRIDEGDFFNDTALLGEEQSRLTVTAVGPCVCLTLLRGRYERLVSGEA